MTSDAPKNETFTFHHPELGPMTGLLTSDNVVQFKGVPFASIPGRFKQSVLLDSLPSDSSRDFTKLSYAAPQTFPDELAGGGPFPNDPSPHPTHEFSCLNLQINVPLACLTSSPKLANLPLLIYIHGGGFVLGKIDAQHNTAHLCSQALLSKQPLVTAAIQYRLGALGYLYTASDAGEHENRALGDQRNALLWLQKFVRGFGGDVQRMTVFGESAGAISIACHMLSRVPGTGRLFGRAVLMSGVLGPMVVPVSRDEAQERYDEFLGVLGIEERGKRALERLREVEVDRIVEATAVLNERGAMWLPVRDEGFFVDEVVGMTWERFPEAMSACEWVDEIVLGTTGFEGTTQMSRVASISARKFLDGITAKMGDESAKLISKAYDIEPTTDQNLFITQAMRWMGDVIFDAPTHEVARHLSTKSNKKIYRYIFDVRNPFPNHAFYQLAHHWVDVYFVFTAHQFRYSSQRLKDISTKHAQLWIEFANGKAPWTEYKYTGNGDEVIMVADEREGWVEKTVAENEEIMEWSWKRCEALWESWKRESGKPFLPLKIVPLDGKKLT